MYSQQGNSISEGSEGSGLNILKAPSKSRRQTQKASRRGPECSVGLDSSLSFLNGSSSRMKALTSPPQPIEMSASADSELTLNFIRCSAPKGTSRGISPLPRDSPVPRISPPSSVEQCRGHLRAGLGKGRSRSRRQEQHFYVRGKCPTWVRGLALPWDPQ